MINKTESQNDINNRNNISMCNLAWSFGKSYLKKYIYIYALYINVGHISMFLLKKRKNLYQKGKKYIMQGTKNE